MDSKWRDEIAGKLALSQKRATAQLRDRVIFRMVPDLCGEKRFQQGSLSVFSQKEGF